MNLRPSGYEPDELPGCSTPRHFPRAWICGRVFWYRIERLSLFRFGSDLLSHVLRRSTIGATALNCRVRDGIGCFARAMTTKPKKRQRGFTTPLNISVVPSPGCNVCCSVCVAFDCQCFSQRRYPGMSFLTLLFLDQIKPIEQLVPVS